MGNRFLVVPAVLAGALFLLAISPVGGGWYPSQDEIVWSAVENLGGSPVGTCLEGQFLVPREEAGYEKGCLLASRLLPGAQLIKASALRESEEGRWQGADGASLGISWRALDWAEINRENAWLEAWGYAPVSAPAPSGSSVPGLLVLRMEAEGRSCPASYAEDLGELRKYGQVYQTYIARLPGTIQGPDLEEKGRRLVTLLGGRVSEGMCQENLASLSGLSPKLGQGRRTAAGTQLNLQVALRANPESGDTTVYVGTPLLPGSY